MGYMNPNHIVVRETQTATSTAGATTVGPSMRNFQKIHLKGAHAIVKVAGTTTGHGFDVYNGTSSIGRVTLGTAAAESTASATLTGDTTIPAFGTVSVKSLADATGTAQFIFEFQAATDAAQSE
ncbi:MAG: hypothetical protein HQM00_10675 [Magnetococcales bacterium]|nr:hypothetical protein [Magnetococcales bacterium]